MSTERVEITSNFVGEFKVGDNLVYNAFLLCELVDANENGRFNKPVVLQVGSLLEAALSQIIYRAQNYSQEGVPNISEEDRCEIEGETVDKFYSVINVLMKYSVLHDLGNEIYEDLHRLRKYRNKIHIQNDIKVADVSRNEDEAFSDEVCAWALDLNLKILRHISDKFPRPPHIQGYVNALSIPSP